MEMYIYDSDNQQRWSAFYRVMGKGNARIVQIESTSSITVVVCKVLVDWYADAGLPPFYRYYVSVPNFNAVTDGHESLQQTEHLTEALIGRGMPQVDARTVAQVLHQVADLLEGVTE